MYIAFTVFMAILARLHMRKLQLYLGNTWKQWCQSCEEIIPVLCIKQELIWSNQVKYNKRGTFQTGPYNKTLTTDA